jgi:hypothetical protein
MYKFSITPINGFSFASLTGLVESDEELHDKIIKHLNIYFSDGYKNIIIHDKQIFYHNVAVGEIEYEGKLNFFQDLKLGLKKAIRYIKMPYRWSNDDE